MLPEKALEVAEHLAQKAEREAAKGKNVLPKQEDIFRAFLLTPPEKVKAVILGQDPYHGPGQANGLAFSVNDRVKLPSSLRNIFKELCADTGCDMPQSGDLTPWAEQGILLLNTVLTVEQGKPNSHAKWGWQVVTEIAIQYLANRIQPTAFLLWGAQARAFAQSLELSGRRLVLCSSHPSPLGAYKSTKEAPAFIGSRPFSRTNAWLENKGVRPIDWTL